MKQPNRAFGPIQCLAVAFCAIGLLGTAASASASASATPPTIDSESVANVTEHNATLDADINPNGLLTKYKLQIDTTGKFKFDQNDGCALHPPGIFCAQVLIPGDPLPPGLVEPPEWSLPASSESQHVSVDLASIGATLQPDTTYHYRAIAANGIPVVVGEDQTFMTPPATGPPTTSTPTVEAVDGSFYWVVGEETGTLHLRGWVNPNGMNTSCTFEYGLDADLSLSVPCAEDPGSGAEPIVVEAEVDGIPVQPWSFDHFRLAATNGGGTQMSLPMPISFVHADTACAINGLPPGCLETAESVTPSTDATGLSSSAAIQTAALASPSHPRRRICQRRARKHHAQKDQRRSRKAWRTSRKCR